jgi:proteasome maturation protein
MLPFLTAPVDVMREGLSANSVAVNAVNHPVEQIQKIGGVQQQMTRKAMLAKVYGAHMAMQMEMEEQILSQFRRFPGLQSSMVGLETVLDQDETIGFADFLGQKEYSEQQVNVLAEMEKRLNM